jgi:hypothetical protein
MDFHQNEKAAAILVYNLPLAPLQRGKHLRMARRPGELHASQ